MQRDVSGELNESIGDPDDTMVDSFLMKNKIEDNSVLTKKNNRTSASRPKSTVKSIRESIGFINTNRYGEGRRIDEDSDEGDRIVSIKQRQSEKIEKLGTFATTASIFKAFVGLGVLFLPNQFWETGLIAMPTIMVGSLFLTLYCTKLLLICADDYGDSYSEIAESAYGGGMKKLTEILIILSQMSFCTNYVYFISSQIGSIFYCNRDLTPDQIETCGEALLVKENVNLWWFLPALMCVFVPLVFIRKMEKLAFTHLIGDVIIITVVTTVLVYAGQKFVTNPGLAIETGAVSTYITSSAVSAVPYSAFAFEGVAVVLPLRDIVADKKNFYKRVCLVVGAICFFYILFGEVCVMAWGDMEKIVLITDGLPPTSYVTYSLKVLYTINLFCSYPLMMSPAINLIEGYIFTASQKPTTGRYWMQNALRTLLVMITITLALSIYEYITVFIEVVAAATCAPLAFTLPALFHYKLKGGNKAHLAIAILTTILTIYMIITSMIKLIQDLTA